MNSSDNGSPSRPETKLPESRQGAGWWLALIVSLVLVVWHFGFVGRYGADDSMSVFSWLYQAWNPANDYEHGKLIPFLIVALIFYRHRELRDSVQSGSYWGLLFVALGCLFYLAAYRTIQPRIAVAGIPFLLWGAAWFVWGWRVARLVAFPLLLIWMAIPLPTFQQFTIHLQLVATQLAHHGSGLFGVETYTQGTTVLPVEGDWKPLSIAYGCSGIRSLMALLMISAAWAYVAKIALWKKFLLFISAVPLAIFGNALRVVSIFVIAEYGDAEWASTTWHDWSGLLLFYPISMLLLLSVHSILEGGRPWKSAKQRQLVKTRVQAAEELTPKP